MTTTKLTLDETLPGEPFAEAPRPNVLCYSDESGWDMSDCASIALITGTHDAMDEVGCALAMVTGESELKWKSIDGGSKAREATNALECVLNAARDGGLRVDTIIWDQRSGRMGYEGHDEFKVLRDMYSQIVKTVLGRRWTTALSWTHYADQQTAFDGMMIETAIRRRLLRLSENEGIRGLADLVKPIQQVDSKEFRMVQMADLFAGLARFSYVNYDMLKAGPGQQTLSGLVDGVECSPEPSNSEQHRIDVFTKFLRKCGSLGLGVSLDPKHRGLITTPTNKPVSFWHYQPQADEDTGARRHDRRAY